MTTTDNPYFWVFRPMFSEVDAAATIAPDWSAGGAEDHASINLMTDVNGYISGVQVKNSGAASEVNILANVLKVISPGAMDGLELRDGYLRVWRGNVQRIVGNGFGPDGLMDYFGPNVGAGNAGKAIATMWMDVNGNAYWGGSLAAGVLRNAAQSTQTALNGTTVTTGMFSTNGRNKSVVFGLNRVVTLRKTDGVGRTGFEAGAGSNTATINVYRTLLNQGEQLWQQFTVGGGVDIFNNDDAADMATLYWSGSLTMNDNADGTTQRSYRAEIVGSTGQSVVHTSGTYNIQTTNQSLSIVSTEI